MCVQYVSVMLSILSYLGSHFSIVHPAQGGKVCGFSTVEAMVKAGMVAIGKGDHELPFILSYLIIGKRKTRQKIYTFNKAASQD